MSERSGLLNLADRLERLIHENSTAAAQPRKTTRAPASASVMVETGEPEEPAVAAQWPAMQTAPPATRGALRVLIAEADLLHREVLAHMVENAGYLVDCVDSGADALLAIQNRPYAMAMVDCDSGEMRGLETAADIRLLDGAAGRISIIALTIGGKEEQRHQRQAAGIDNYLAKPVLLENVETLLSRYAPAAKSEPLARYLALDRHRLLELDVASGESPVWFCRWIQMFLARAPEQLERMRAAQEAGDPGALSEAAGKLRSLSGQIGALRVQETCGILSALCGTGNLAGTEPLIPEAAVALDRAIRELHVLESDLQAGRRLGRPLSRQREPLAARGNEVLVVEDDPLIARFLVSGLAGAEFPSTHLTSGRAALEALGQHSFGAVVLDLDVSEVDGFNVLSEIRVSPQRDLPVMIVSSRRQEHDILRAFELGADDYVTIPFSPLEVVARLRRLVRQGAFSG